MSAQNDNKEHSDGVDDDYFKHQLNLTGLEKWKQLVKIRQLDTSTHQNTSTGKKYRIMPRQLSPSPHFVSKYLKRWPVKAKQQHGGMENDPNSNGKQEQTEMAEDSDDNDVICLDGEYYFKLVQMIISKDCQIIRKV